VDSSSFLTGAVRGRGLGKQMRAAVLTLAFGPLGARFAITSAWSDNHASLGVSRALGYVENGETADRRDDVAEERPTYGSPASGGQPRGGRSR
jgi:RimJ/RimL family protein N-acetyltransferase